MEIGTLRVVLALCVPSESNIDVSRATQLCFRLVAPTIMLLKIIF